MLKYSLPALVIGFVLDLLIGDPRWLYHPICVIGNLIAVLEKVIRKIFPKNHGGELTGGFLIVVLVCLFSGGVPLLVLYYLYRYLPVAGFVLEVFWCYQLLATRSLKDESMKVYDRLKNGTLDEARYAVSMIVGRDTRELTETGVTKAAVETVAENASDGVIAPMLYMAIGGVPLMFLYKGINTMDSMLGYKNDKYLYFGRIAAKLADFVIVTSDNPRTEDPEAIIEEILTGMADTNTPYAVVPNRVEAIHYAMDHARSGDVIILAGKGHETYQEVNHKKHHMDEREIVAEHLDTTR